ncbi:GTP:AMP phosphotransferase [Nannizzia gypsea CBS 118893]|uniref:GTP:AMP phosphotransferase, mitochondrial n=1 Tax=Arthroderma gypseum (strain ATCC MYA-4604 / CBS 118893) TaxID=535722 RepID=E4V093_ARTGP|nr:GTP:AMP phosphotransferase [Nannizzia gypsea CBS 118893]EFR03030.1 GTP:AMP phosphotransferase [Nannizzia gypsea CBS 118893]
MAGAATRRLKKAARIILVGAPGVGKGTQTERLIKRYPQLASISSGDLLRENIRNKTEIGLKVQSALHAGQLVPDATILELISSELTSKGWLVPSTNVSSKSAPSSKKSLNSSASFILDGFPRTAIQANSLESLVPINLVVHLLTPPAIILSRISSRWVHPGSGRVYNTEFNAPKVPGKDDITGEPLVQRDDDSTEVWKERFQKFEETSKPLLDHYEGKGCVLRIEGNSSDDISPKLFAEIDRRFC